MDTLELLVRTHFTLKVAEKGTMLKDVIGYGSGFMMSYNGYKFFVTAVHVNEPTWSTRSEEIEIRNNDIAIATHLSCEQNGVKQTVYIPIGDFLYVNEFLVDPSNFDFPAAVEEAERNPVPVDVAVALVKERPGVFTHVSPLCGGTAWQYPKAGCASRKTGWTGNDRSSSSLSLHSTAQTT